MQNCFKKLKTEPLKVNATVFDSKCLFLRPNQMQIVEFKTELLNNQYKWLHLSSMSVKQSQVNTIEVLNVDNGEYEINDVIQLKQLSVQNCKVQFTRFISNSLVELTVNGCGLNNMLFVADFKNLRKLVLFNNNITDARAVSKLIHLEHLNLSNNSIISFKPLESLKNISELHVNSNKIKCIMFLSVFQKLHTLYIVDNQITDINQFAVLMNSRALKYVHVDDNPVLNNPETKLRLQRFINEKFRDQMFKPFLPFNKCFINIGANYNQRHQIRIQLLRNKGVELKNALQLKQQITINTFMFQKMALFLNCFKSFVGFE
ncbi:Conserved_hypothetical protein [Hexamita inflata]|uniref:Uncharacterized protein n=1 Tax=Hexamita inflata TaxID=28002 RepID=A0AA86U6F2_9EUKA|nr:Conserved hypothetical protein [Hexamita inflata]